jgi:hypothetical protein
MSCERRFNDEMVSDLPECGEVVFDANEPSRAERDQIVEYVNAILKETTEPDPKTVISRALGIYRAIVEHARAGGTVRFIAPNGAGLRTLKVRLR